MYMSRKFIIALFALFSFNINAATPFGGPYINLFGGYAAIPSNVETGGFNNVHYQAGYDAGGSLGYKSGPFRYEIQLAYLYASVSTFEFNGVTQTTTTGRTGGGTIMLDLIYDFENLNTALAPYLGIGVGGARIDTKLNSSLPSTTAYQNQRSMFAYQGLAGVTYNFSESISTDLHYRYVITTNNQSFNRVFQGHLFNLGVTYRYNS